jgi:hypothetical protein
MRGPAALRHRFTSRELVDRWRRDDEIVSITDLHVRETPLKRLVDTRAISEFNILRLGSDDVSWHEMMTLVFSSKGAVTDSHSDDPDGSNHCFAGRKLWLVWNTFEGRGVGLQDVERDSVRERAAFSMKQFLAVPSARWFVVSPGLTLFLPGDLTHKVITIERYVGIGSFYLAPPNAVRTIARWLRHGPLWLNDGIRGNTWALVDEVAETACVAIERWRRGTSQQQRRLGLHLLKPSARQWARSVPTVTRARLLRNSAFRRLLAEALR